MSSSTSDRPRPGAERIVGWVRVVHPFPSILDGLVSGGIAFLGGGSVALAIQVGLAMAVLQFGIGAVNDIVDAPRDAGRKPGKPIPAGVVAIGTARIVATGLFVVGTLISWSISGPMGGLALGIIAIGLGYDLWLKGTAWSWLPFAIGIPILPVFGWLAATGTLSAAFAILVPAGVVAGAGLAIGNALVDVERDEAAGVSSIAVALGRVRSAWLTTLLFTIAGVAAVGSGMIAGMPAPTVVVLAFAGVVPIAASRTVVAAGAGRRERAWQAEAVGLAVLAAAWIASIVGAGAR
ncbi:MAG: hypothetical protein QOF49_282 [Chloroflexota bacterium]|nr:hypothetical protein [Chloroflexota bacterium]